MTRREGVVGVRLGRHRQGGGWSYLGFRMLAWPLGRRRFLPEVRGVGWGHMARRGEALGVMVGEVGRVCRGGGLVFFRILT